MPAFRRILHASDFSRASAPAFARAVALAREHRAALVLLHVTTPPAVLLEDSFMTARTWTRLEADSARRARGQLGRLAARARRAGVRASVLVRSGMAFQEIVTAARRQRADLVVIGTHGRTGLPRFLLGSVAERVVALARCPVLTVRGR